MWLWIFVLLSKAVLGQINQTEAQVSEMIAQSSRPEYCCRMVNVTETFTRNVTKCHTYYVPNCQYLYDKPCMNGCIPKVRF